MYPDPAQTKLVLDFKYDARWVGQELIITNAIGQILIRHLIISKAEIIDIGKLNRGVYFIRGNKDGIKLSAKFIKL